MSDVTEQNRRELEAQLRRQKANLERLKRSNAVDQHGPFCASRILSVEHCTCR